MKVYAVGGWVRDQLLSADAARSNGDGANRDRSDRPDPRQRSDRDWVVVGARAEDLVAAGYRPVGRDFPVFLHPVTHEEYALARTERKTAPGYHGFVFHAAPDVTLEQDLARRDLTINAIARAEDGTLIDPYGGRRDLAARVLRHIGPAFAEDPVRILRVARFAGRWPDFTLAPETLALMRQMVAAGEVDALVPERVWQELARGLMETQPSRLLQVLHDCGALARLLPEIERVLPPASAAGEGPATPRLLRRIDCAARMKAPLPARWATLLQDLAATSATSAAAGDAPPAALDPRAVEVARAACERLRVPADCRDAALTAAREHRVLADALALDATGLIDLLERCDALRRPQVLAHALTACEAEFHAARGADAIDEAVRFLPRVRVEAALAAARTIDAGAIAAQFLAAARALAKTSAAADRGVRIAQAVRAARVNAVAAMLAQAR